MDVKHVMARVKLGYGDRPEEVEAIVDAGASVSVVSRRLAERLGCFRPAMKPYELRTAEEGGFVRIIGYRRATVALEGYEMPGETTFEAAENLSRDLIIGRPEIDKWDVVFTPEGPRPRKYPVELELI